jgi:hypothetical protein
LSKKQEPSFIQVLCIFCEETGHEFLSEINLPQMPLAIGDVIVEAAGISSSSPQMMAEIYQSHTLRPFKLAHFDFICRRSRM